MLDERKMAMVFGLLAALAMACARRHSWWSLATTVLMMRPCSASCWTNLWAKRFNEPKRAPSERGLGHGETMQGMLFS